MRFAQFEHILADLLQVGHNIESPNFRRVPVFAGIPHKSHLGHPELHRLQTVNVLELPGSV
jgi:hypothetical protein